MSAIIMCAKYYEFRHMFKKMYLVKLARLLDKLIASKLAVFSVSGLKDENLIKRKPT